MSANEHDGQQPEVKSSIKVTRNAKQDAQWDVRVVAGATMEELDELRRVAVAQHRALVTEIGS